MVLVVTWLPSSHPTNIDFYLELGVVMVTVTMLVHIAVRHLSHYDVLGAVPPSRCLWMCRCYCAKPPWHILGSPGLDVPQRLRTITTAHPWAPGGGFTKGNPVGVSNLGRLITSINGIAWPVTLWQFDMWVSLICDCLEFVSILRQFGTGPHHTDSHSHPCA